MTAKEELEESRAWRESCPIGPEGDVKPIDLKVIEPYKKVISHGGYYHLKNDEHLDKANGTSNLKHLY